MKMDMDKFIDAVNNTKGSNLNIRCTGLMLSLINKMDKNKSEFTRDCISANPENLIALDKVKEELEQRSKDLSLKFAQGEIRHKELLSTLQALEVVEQELIRCAKACKDNFDRIDKLKRRGDYVV